MENKCLSIITFHFFVIFNIFAQNHFVPNHPKSRIEEGSAIKPLLNNENIKAILQIESFLENDIPYFIQKANNIGESNLYIRSNHQMNSKTIIKMPNGSFWQSPISPKRTGYTICKPNEVHYLSYLRLDTSGIKSYGFDQIGNYEFSWKVYQNDDRTGKEWTSNKLIVNIDEKGEVTLIDDLPSPDWTDEQITEHLQKYENLENEKHIAKTFTEKIKNLNFNKPKEDSDKAISEPQKNENSKSKIFIIFGVLFTIIFGGFFICKTRKKKNRKQEEK